MLGSYEDIHRRLVEAVAEFRPVLEEHLELHGESLPHVLFGDLTRFILKAHSVGNEDVVMRALNFLDDELVGGDPAVAELVAVSFVENTGPWDDTMQTFISTWPEALRQEARRQQEWTPDAQ